MVILFSVGSQHGQGFSHSNMSSHIFQSFPGSFNHHSSTTVRVVRVINIVVILSSSLRHINFVEFIIMNLNH